MEESKLPAAEKIEHIMRAACRSSIKSGDAIALQETERLLRDLFRCRSPYTCPHGRPTVYKLSAGELERFFARK
jgi:DNA mismatch repair protein MutL